ncbi:hypothetical protein LK542_16120 [Massilia sp. IC2-477]|uniref:hypothetical protein n=1 Tax=Massilia sp. IC2-477 TaxID=2887198 RepID=UPI001D10CC9F|nr:hypothetical protein [Massilia sp. IC2-477]MCC2957144.1 hypothetical protein [Massilia sp. IC2-477]
MHLAEVEPAVQVGRKIYRKDVLGQAGQIYGSNQRKIHFEIVCDDENLRKLGGRDKGGLKFEKDGRTDCVYGSIYFWLPPGTKIFRLKPLDSSATAQIAADVSGQKNLSQTLPIPEVHVVQNALVVELYYNCGDGQYENKGSALTRTYDENGIPIGSIVTENEAEYQLYSRACTIRNSLPASTQPPVSALYEQLRFGRVINQIREKPLSADVPHWREISYPGGVGWANFNASQIRKYSDADLPEWCGWIIADDSADRDSRCDSDVVLSLIAPGDERTKSSSIQTKLRVAFQNPHVKRRLDRVICKIPSEWNVKTIDARWSWLKQKSDVCPEPLDDKDYALLRSHISTLGFETAALEGALWHWNPVMFVKHFRKCSWLSLDELAGLLPRRSGPDPAKPAVVPWGTAVERMRPYVAELNMAMRKYGISTRLRQAHFLAQTYIETGLWRTMEEVGKGYQSRKKDGTLFWAAPAMEFYQAFYGRGIMQLTWPDNYNSYGLYRSFPNVPDGHVYKDRRIDSRSLHYWSDPRGRSRQIVGSSQSWAPRFDPDIVSTDSFNACDSGAHYWVSKKIGRNLNINRVADKGLTPQEVGRVSVLVNGGGYGFVERQAYAKFIERYLHDDVGLNENTRFAVNYRGTNHDVYVDFTPQRPR